MNDDELGGLLAESARRRVRNVRPQADPDELLQRIEVRARRQRALAVLAGVCLAVGGVVVGLAVAGTRDDGATVTAPEAATAPAAPALVPGDPEAARAAIAGAYHDVFTSNVAAGQRSAAVQAGFDPSLFARGRDAGLALHLTSDQLAGVTVSTTDIAFVDATHATVTFVIDVPGNAALSVPHAGYAVYEDGRWKVAWRTACDVLRVVADQSSCPRTG